ncbi:glycerol-3-phosphate acyltransferase [bacterium]|nr:MAG: glycerol-3-phosphate acyltransferase [bacterium]
MDIGLIVIGLIGSYLLGSLPFGLLIVKLSTGKDLRDVESGRTGGTNAMRAAGFLVGLLTATLDMLKGAAAVLLVRNLLPGLVWVEVAAPLAAIMGHNYSIFLIEKLSGGKLHLGGGAGGAPCVGGAFGLWPPSLFITLPLLGAVWYGVGYASVATMSAALAAIVIFAIRASLGLSPWVYILYGVFAELILLWALRPNLRRLAAGNERLVGWRARRRDKKNKLSDNPGKI